MNENTSLRGSVALVTGASSGIGAHCAQVLAQAGCAVALGARRADRIAAGVAAIEGSGGRAVAVALDVTDEASIEAAYTSIEGTLGNVRILINNAGIGTASPALDLTRSAWDDVMATNLTGPWLVARAFARRAKAAAHGGAIVNIASIAGLRAGSGLSAYGASKAALIHLTQSLAGEWVRYGIRVNAIAPGYIKTDMNAAFFETPAGEAMVARIPQRRLGRFEDLDGALLLLASDASAYMTGATIPIDGGHLLAGM